MPYPPQADKKYSTKTTRVSAPVFNITAGLNLRVSASMADPTRVPFSPLRRLCSACDLLACLTCKKNWVCLSLLLVPTPLGSCSLYTEAFSLQHRGLCVCGVWLLGSCFSPGQLPVPSSLLSVSSPGFRKGTKRTVRIH